MKIVAHRKMERNKKKDKQLYLACAHGNILHPSGMVPLQRGPASDIRIRIRIRIRLHLFQPHQADQMPGCHWTSQFHKRTSCLNMHE